MGIPDLDNRGLLPQGIHRCALCDIPPRFCFNDYRWRLWDDALSGLERVCNELLSYGRTGYPIILAGSFFSDKPMPSDIEATIILTEPISPDEFVFWSMFGITERDIIHQETRLDVCPSLPNGNDFTRFFQYAGPKTANEKHIDPKDLRGIVQVNPW